MLLWHVLMTHKTWRQTSSDVKIQRTWWPTSTAWSWLKGVRPDSNPKGPNKWLKTRPAFWPWSIWGSHPAPKRWCFFDFFFFRTFAEAVMVLPDSNFWGIRRGVPSVRYMWYIYQRLWLHQPSILPSHQEKEEHIKKIDFCNVQYCLMGPTSA